MRMTKTMNRSKMRAVVPTLMLRETAEKRRKGKESSPRMTMMSLVRIWMPTWMRASIRMSSRPFRKRPLILKSLVQEGLVVVREPLEFRTCLINRHHLKNNLKR